MARELVVDDDGDILDMLREVLADEGHLVGEVADGQAALDLLRATPQRWVVLLDYRTPVLDGRAVLEAVASDSFLARQHAYIACPATSNLDGPVAALRTALGIPLLPKPFNVEHVLDAIAQAETRLQG
jgi:sigma-B regulation protein RsbU (phosphoserine phosphatase)